MIFRQLFDMRSCTYSYLIASRTGGEAMIIDPVLEETEHYMRLLDELDLKLVKALDTHVHADHLSGLGELRDRTRCATVMGKQSGVDVVSVRVGDGDEIEIEGLCLKAMHTPGHTDDSYCFVLDDRVFTGDTLLIRGTGRTDFQNGDPVAQYDSIFNKLLALPDETLVYPGHDYKGDTVSTIREERAFNPRLQVGSVAQYVEFMNNLKLEKPRMMNVAVPSNLHIGLVQDDLEKRSLTLTSEAAMELLGKPDVLLVDIRDRSEQVRDGMIPGAVHAPYGTLDSTVAAHGMLHEMATTMGKELLFICAYGERSALAVHIAEENGLNHVRHVSGGLDAWKKAGGPVEFPE